MKLADFGLAKKSSFLQRRKSNSIVSLWYRAPEIILGSEDYLLGVDIWSIGCIFGELMQTKPVYYCKSDEEVLDRVFKFWGTPSSDNVPMLLKQRRFGEFQFKKYKKPESLKDFFPYAADNDDAIDLLSKLMNMDSKLRITAKEAMEHPFFKK